MNHSFPRLFDIFSKLREFSLTEKSSHFSSAGGNLVIYFQSKPAANNVFLYVFITMEMYTNMFNKMVHGLYISLCILQNKLVSVGIVQTCAYTCND